ncbi:hypothetical protein QJS10_CPA16g01584 [Acorus calamus]|uniref:HMA domain-containing protein n=1 Tax=Acorus calamus TaxID=4465 RepID=A0AAV9D5F4_ACOCL|nr:hypothetical protein QJS10_CPA16g01584 [Acorus calamus]
MAQELEKARVTEIQVRMDCNGCVHKIKKALHNIDGIYDVYIDFPQQKLTVVGRADPEKILKAIKKSCKTATICSHTEPDNQPPNPTQATEGEQPAPDSTGNPPSEPPPPAEPAKEEPPQQQSTAPEATEPPVASQPVAQSELKIVDDIYMVHHYPDRHVYGYNDHWNSYPSEHVPLDETPYQVIHSYSNYRPSPYVSGYTYRGEPHVEEDYYYAQEGHSGERDNSMPMFRDENPQTCSIV